MTLDRLRRMSSWITWLDANGFGGTVLYYRTIEKLNSAVADQVQELARQRMEEGRQRQIDADRSRHARIRTARRHPARVPAFGQ